MSYFYTVITAAVFVFTYVAVVVIRNVYITRRLGMPKGPPNLPIFGSLLSVLIKGGTKPYVGFMNLAKDYGDYMTIGASGEHVVVANGLKACREICSREEFLERYPQPWLMERTFKKPLGILFGSYAMWKESKRFCLRQMRDFGFGKTLSMVASATEESAYFVESIKSQLKLNKITQLEEGVVQMDPLYAPHVINVVWAFVTGKLISHRDDSLPKLVSLVDQFFYSFKIGANLLTLFPHSYKTFPKLSGFEAMNSCNLKIHDFIRAYIKETLKKGTYAEHPESFVESFLYKIHSEKCQDRDSDGEYVFTEENLISIMYDFFMAGAETTSHIMSFLFLYMILKPDIQDKVRHEIYEVIGKTGSPTQEHLKKMPFTEATILEALRIAAVLPLSPRRAVKTAHIGDIVIPKGTNLLLNLYSAHYDSSVWTDANDFRPERFIDIEGKICNADKILPFGLGKKICFGESLARIMIFIFTTNLVQNFTFLPVPDEPLPTLTPNVGMTIFPKPYKALVKVN